MLNLVLYQKVQSLFALDVVESFKSSSESSSVVVVPNPSLSDLLRKKFLDLGIQVEVLTISKFLENKFYQSQEDKSPYKLCSKNELILLLGKVWRRLFPEKSFNEFINTYNLFSEVRSHTLSIEVCEELFSELDSITEKGARSFWQVLDSLKIYDEHKATSYLQQFVRNNNGDIFKDYKIIFWGFAHLSLVQSDLIMAVSEYADVYVPFPLIAYQELKKNDAFYWPFEMESASSFQKIFPDGEQLLYPDEVRFKEYVKDELSELVKAYQEEIGPQTSQNLYISDTSDYKHLIFAENFYFKVDQNIFKNLVDITFQKIKKEIADKTIHVDQFEEMIKKMLTDEFSKKTLKDYRRLKVLGMLLNLTKEWIELSESNNIDQFELDLFYMVVTLKLPRVFSIPIDKWGSIKGEKYSKSEIRQLSNMDFYDQGEKAIIILKDKDLRLVDGRPLIEKIYAILKSIGPISRSEINKILLKSKLIELLTNADASLFLERAADGESLWWRELFNPDQKFREFDGFTETKEELNSNQNIDKLKLEEHESERDFFLSASKIQNYLNCSRKYYFENVLKVVPRVINSNILAANELGEIEHKVIETYFQKHKCWSINNLRQVILDIYLNYKADNKKDIEFVFESQYLMEIENHSRNAIEFILDIGKRYKKVKFDFERPVKKKVFNYVCKGRPDLIIEGDFGIGLIDFKRSSNSIPSRVEVLNMENIQLWFYLSCLNIEISSVAFWGFFNLKKPNESLLISNRKDFKDLGIKNISEELEILLGNYLRKEEEIINKIDSKIYLPNPRKKEICDYCFIKNICSSF